MSGDPQGTAPGPVQLPTSEWTYPPPPKPGRLQRFLPQVLVGAATSFVVLALVYGLNNAVMGLALVVLCTAGIGLIPLLFVSWLVGWIVTALWRALRRKPDPSGSAA